MKRLFSENTEHSSSSYQGVKVTKGLYVDFPDLTITIDGKAQ